MSLNSGKRNCLQVASPLRENTVRMTYFKNRGTIKFFKATFSYDFSIIAIFIGPMT